jgi:hypothetical protein
LTGSVVKAEPEEERNMHMIFSAAIWLFWQADPNTTGMAVSQYFLLAVQWVGTIVGVGFGVEAAAQYRQGNAHFWHNLLGVVLGLGFAAGSGIIAARWFV